MWESTGQFKESKDWWWERLIVKCENDLKFTPCIIVLMFLGLGFKLLKAKNPIKTLIILATNKKM
jgi:hypothetical protein